MPCEWFSLLPECDIPNWIIGVIGIGIAIALFAIQGFQGKKINRIITESHVKDSKRRVLALYNIDNYLEVVNNNLNKLFETDATSKERVIDIEFRNRQIRVMTHFVNKISNTVDTNSDTLPRRLILEAGFLHTFFFFYIETAPNEREVDKKNLEQSVKDIQEIMKELKKEFSDSALLSIFNDDDKSLESKVDSLDGK